MILLTWVPDPAWDDLPRERNLACTDIAIGTPAATCIAMPGDDAEATLPGHANGTLHPTNDAWRYLKIRWESTPAYPNDQLSLDA